MRERIILRMDEEESYADEQCHGKQLADGEDIAQYRGPSHTYDIYARQYKHYAAHDRQARCSRACLGPKVAQIIHQHIACESNAAHPRKISHPSNFEPNQGTEGLTHVKICAARSGEPAGNLGVSDGYDHHNQSARDKREEAVRTDKCIRL